MLAYILSIIAIVLSGASLGWQVMTWRRSGPVVRVTAQQMYPAAPFSSLGSLVSVTAANTGRAPVSIDGWGFELPDGFTLQAPVQMPISDVLPYRLEPGAAARWHIPTAQVLELCEQRGVLHRDLRSFAWLADGTMVRAAQAGIGIA